MKRTACYGLLLALVWGGSANAAYTVSFDSPTYTINIGQSLTVVLQYAVTGGDTPLPLSAATVNFAATTPGPAAPAASAINFKPGAGYIFDDTNTTTTNFVTGYSPPGAEHIYDGFLATSIFGPYGSTNSAVSTGNLAQFTFDTVSLTPGSYTLDIPQFVVYEFVSSTMINPVLGAGGTANLTVTPEPAVFGQLLAMVGLAGPGLMYRRWRRGKQAATAA